MKNLWDRIFLLMVWMVFSIDAQRQFSYYKRKYYSPIESHPSTFYKHSNHYITVPYPGDLVPQASKRKENKGFAKKLPFRPYLSEEEDISNERYSTSAEYSNESHGYPYSGENDSREYSIGSHIHVQHPISVPKKQTSSHAKHSKYLHSSPYLSGKYNEADISSEIRAPDYSPLKKRPNKYTQIIESEPVHIVPPPKTLLTSPSSSYNVFEAEPEEYEIEPSSRRKPTLLEQFKGIASKKQIEQYLRDQQQLLDEALKLQLLNSPKFQEFLKSEEKEKFYEREIQGSLPPHVRQTINEHFGLRPSRSRRRPPHLPELKRPPKGKPGLGPKSKRKFRSALVIDI